MQKTIVSTITEQGGDYVIGLKGNPKTLFQAVKATFEKAELTELNDGACFDFYQTENRGQGYKNPSSLGENFNRFPVLWSIKKIGGVIGGGTGILHEKTAGIFSPTRRFPMILTETVNGTWHPCRVYFGHEGFV